MLTLFKTEVINMSKFLEKMSDAVLENYIMNCILQSQKYEYMMKKYKQKAMAANEVKLKRILKKNA